MPCTQSFGWTALHWAADRGLLEVTNMLLDYNADVNAMDLNEATPLIAAVKSNCLATARALLARGATIDPIDVRNFLRCASTLQQRKAISPAIQACHSAPPDMQPYVNLHVHEPAFCENRNGGTTLWPLQKALQGTRKWQPS